MRRLGPEIDELVDSRGGVGRKNRPVERADRGANHEIGCDATFEQRAQHAHLHGTECAATTKHEPNRTRQRCQYRT